MCPVLILVSVGKLNTGPKYSARLAQRHVGEVGKVDVPWHVVVVIRNTVETIGTGPAAPSQLNVPVKEVLSSRETTSTAAYIPSAWESAAITRKGKKGMSNATGKNRQISPRVTINTLPDEVLLEIFDFCRAAIMDQIIVRSWEWQTEWHTFVHVCQRWRYVIFSSPLGLDLRLYCTDTGHVREMLDVWPPFPIEICSYSEKIGDDVMAALEHHDRICQISLSLAKSHSEDPRLATLIQKPFPALTSLQLVSLHRHGNPLVLSDGILGGSAPRLRSVSLNGFPFLTFPRLLLSSNDLSELWLHNIPDIPDIGYISPEAMVTGLSALTCLTALLIEFKFGRSGTVQGPPPVTRALLPALTYFQFRGVSEYLEDLLSRIDAPQLKRFSAQLFGPHINIRQVIRVSQSLTLRPFKRAHVHLGPYDANITLYESESVDELADSAPFYLVIMEDEDVPGQQVLSMAQICTQSLPILSSVTYLDIRGDRFDRWTGHNLEVLMDNLAWPVLFQPFTAVRTLRLSGEIRSFVISSLQGHTGEGVTELLPELQNIYLFQSHWQDKIQEPAIDRFIAARQLSDHPIAVHRLPQRRT
ncbi:hypothetical protein BGW80DRAFT_1257640 [Lactifluus volemus]|nr:hypothetical protein BGW80DRAFT_1257640 [Lactifluus volemus]